MARGWRLTRRSMLLGSCTTALSTVARKVSAEKPDGAIRFGLTPVFLTSDLALLADLKFYLEKATGRPVQLVSRRTYQEITALLISRQLDAAWICGYPFVAYRNELTLLAVPVWHGRTLYQSYLIANARQAGSNLKDLRGTVHAFSDPDSNSGYLVTRAALVELGVSPYEFFRQFFFTYGHRNVIRAVSAGLAMSGSVDGYVYEVLQDTEPELVKSTRILTKSEWLGFPPIACSSAQRETEPTRLVQKALIDMEGDESGRAVLSLLRLDGFRVEAPELFDPIAVKMNQVRREELR